MKKIIYLGILVFIVSIGIGYFYLSAFFNNGKENLKAEEFEANQIKDYAMQNYTKLQTLQASTETEKISPNTHFAIKQYYDECNHFDFKYSKLPKELVNLTRQEIEDYYSDYEVEDFSSDELVISKEINGFCNEHFYITLGDEHIEVMQLDTDGSFIPYQETNISKEYLAPEDVSKLEQGIYIYGSGNINSILEDYE